MGFDDRKSTLSDSEKQLMGHTKAYTKVVLNQTEEVLGADQPAKALIGKCVKIMITETHKWHIAGVIIDASPKPVEAPEDYFEKLDLDRKEKLRKELQDDLAVQKQRELDRKALLSVSSTNDDNKEEIELKREAVRDQLIGMMLVTFGVFWILKYLF